MSSTPPSHPAGIISKEELAALKNFNDIQLKAAFLEMKERLQNSLFGALEVLTPEGQHLCDELTDEAMGQMGIAAGHPMGEMLREHVRRDLFGDVEKFEQAMTLFQTYFEDRVRKAREFQRQEQQHQQEQPLEQPQEEQEDDDDFECSQRW